MASPPEARRVEAHLGECPECRRALEWMEATSLVIAKRPVAIPPADLRMRIAQAIAAEAAANTSFRPKPRSFVTRPAFAVAASIALVAVVGISLDHVLKPNPISVVPIRVPAKVADNSSSPPGVKTTGEPRLSLLHPSAARVALGTPSQKPSPLLHPIPVRPQNKPLVASLPNASAGNVPQAAPAPMMHSQPLPPQVKPTPVKQQVASKPTKPTVSRATPSSVRSGPDQVATNLPNELPLRNGNDTMITPSVPSTEPDTTQVIQTEPSHIENVAIHTPSTDVLSVVHQHVLASLAAYKSDNATRMVVRDENEHVQTTAYNSGDGVFPPILSSVHSPTFLSKTPSSPPSTK